MIGYKNGNVKLIHMWRNFRFLLICHVKKFEISPHDSWDPSQRFRSWSQQNPNRRCSTKLPSRLIMLNSFLFLFFRAGRRLTELQINRLIMLNSFLFLFFRAGPRLRELPPIANTTEIQNYFQQERKLFFWTKPESPFDFVLIARRFSPD